MHYIVRGCEEVDFVDHEYWGPLAVKKLGVFGCK